MVNKHTFGNNIALLLSLPKPPSEVLTDRAEVLERRDDTLECLELERPRATSLGIMTSASAAHLGR